MTRSRPSPDPAESIGRDYAPIAELVLPTQRKTDERRNREKGQSRVTYAVTSDGGWFDDRGEGGSTQPPDPKIAEGGSTQPADQNSEIAGSGSTDPADPDPELVEADQVCIHEGGELYVEGMEDQMAMLPEVTPCPPSGNY